MALIADTVGPVDQVQAAAPRTVLTVPYDARTTTFDGLVELLEGVSAAHGNAPIGHLGLVARGRAEAVSLGGADTLDAADMATDSPTWGGSRAADRRDRGGPGVQRVDVRGEIDLTAGPNPLWPFGELFDKGMFVAGQGI